LSISIKKVGVLAVLAAILVALAALRPTADTPVAQADFAAPGGIAALPSAIPAIPGVVNQGIPAIIGTGQPAIVTVFCFNTLEPPGECDDPITFTLERVYPSGDPMATFAATGTDTMVGDDNAGGDLDVQPGVVSVEIDAAAATQGGTQGVNEILKVVATDDSGEARTVTIVVVDTILAWGPTGQVSTASQEQPTFISYHCDKVGRAPIGNVGAGTIEAILGDADGQQGLDDMYDGLYGPFNGVGLGLGTNTLLGDTDYADSWCGGDTTGSLFDDFVDFQTDKGLFSVDPVAVQSEQASIDAGIIGGFFYPPMLADTCGEGKNIDTYDIDALSVWADFFFAPFGAGFQGGCDLDGWRNGVVTTQLLGNGEVGVATVTAQQGGGVSPVRTINVTFVGESALALVITAPAALGINGGDYTVIVVDQDGRPVGDETVQCTVSPAGGALALLNQTGTTGAITSDAPGEVTFTLIPTGASVIAGDELTLTCVLDRDRSVSASETISLSTTPDLESVALVEGCNPVASTWPDATPVADAAGAVAPADALDAIWNFDPATGTWQGYSPTAPAAVSDLDSIDFLDAVFICVNAAATWDRPVI
jgi:lipoprotein-anchoring transpeptidase ErfK/SrfK